MIKALLLIFDPIVTWEGIVLARRSMGSILVIYLSPLLLITSAAEGYGLVKWGKWQDEIGRLKKFPIQEAAAVEVAQILLSLVVVFAGAKMLKSLGDTFHGRHAYSQAFATVAYSLSPLFTLRLLDAFAGVSPWVTWSIGMILSAAVLYHGVPRMIEPDPSHAFGLYIMSALLLALVTGMVRFVTAAYLVGRFPKLQAIISAVAPRWIFS
ncbi:MAG: YIP1 family protein [Verrucomicrobia bacterium]|nr:YIP1 family protein [Verrucomicrobiota bacterium]